MFRSFFIIVTALFTAACNSGSEPKNDEYVGFWKLDNTYLEITTLGEVIIYNCTLADGYTKSNFDFGRVVDDEMIITGEYIESPYKLSIISGQIIGSAGDMKLILDSAELPTQCDNGIKVVYSYPTEVVEGDLTTFTIDFDYRLTTASEAVVRIASPSAEHGLTFYENNLEIKRTELGRGSFTVEGMPYIASDNEEPFSLYIYLFITSQTEIETENSIKFVNDIYTTSLPIVVWEGGNYK